MSAPDITPLLEPLHLSDDAALPIRSGQDFNHPYQQLKNLRSQLRTAERLRIQQGEIEIYLPLEWQPLITLASTLLQHYRKDLEVASWLVEGWLRSAGIKGLNAGLKLLRSLVEQFTDDIKQEDPDTVELQIAAVQGLSGADKPGPLMMPLMSLPLFNTIDGAPIAFWQYQHALTLAQHNDTKKQDEPKVFDLEQIKQAFSILTPNDLTDLLLEYQAAVENVDQCSAIFLKNLKTDITFHHLRNTLRDIIEALESLHRTATPEHSEQPSTKQLKESIVINQRQHALQAIQQAQQYFLDQEKHSPVGYLLQRALYWADLSLPELMREIFQNQEPYFIYGQITGLPVEQHQSMAETE